MKHIILILVCLNFFGAFSLNRISSKKYLTGDSVSVQKSDVKHIIIDLQFDWQKKQAYGTANIILSVKKPTNQINLDAAMLTINSIVTVKEIPLKFSYDGGDKKEGLEIILDRIYKSGEELNIKINYHTNWVNAIDPGNLSGTNGKGLRFSLPTNNDPIKPKEIWSFGDPESNRYWFPGCDAPDDLRTTEFIATVEKKLMVISNGDLINVKDNHNGTHTFHYKSAMPYANHLTSFVVGEFVDVEQNYDGVAIHSYGYPSEKKICNCYCGTIT